MLGLAWSDPRFAPSADGFARRIRRAYTRQATVPIDPDALRWSEGLVCLRALVEVAHWVTAGEVEARRGHPWVVSGPAFAARLPRLTGLSITPR